MIVKAVDSEYPPSSTALAEAKADGVRVWSGYLPGQNIAHGWSEGDFSTIRAAGLSSIAYTSGWVDPSAAKATAAAWGVKGCLDVETSIRPDGSWVQPWLTVSGFGLYGNAPVHQGRTAAFHVLAAYPGHDPGTSWPTPNPTAPTGWQWAGSVAKYGANVDLTWLDAAIFTSPTDPPEPTTPGGPEIFIYQRTNGSIFLCTGTTNIGFGDGADVTYFEGLGYKIAYENHMTIAFAAKLNALPVI